MVVLVVVWVLVLVLVGVVFEYLRCSEISGEIHSRVQRKLVKKDVAMQMFRDRVMCVGIDVVR